LLTVVFETNPLDDPEKSDSKVAVKLESLDLVLNMRMISAVGAFFAPPQSVDLTAMKAQANEQIAKARAYVGGSLPFCAVFVLQVC
jgi:hypothetical protein